MDLWIVVGISGREFSQQHSELSVQPALPQLKAADREVKTLTRGRDALEVDFKAVLARHAREVDVAATARREAVRAQAARAAAEAEAERIRAAASAARCTPMLDWSAAQSASREFTCKNQCRLD